MSTTTPTAAEQQAAGHRPPLRERLDQAQLPVIVVLLVVGGSAWLLDAPTVADAAFGVATAVAFVPALIDSAGALWRREPGVDVIAVLAMLGALLLGEWLAGAIIAVMLTGGEALEDHAAGRARRELTSLLTRAPRIAHIVREDGTLEDAGIDEVAPGDRILVKAGEVIPTDGLLLSERAVLDEAALTGESRPTEVNAGHLVRSGGVAAGGPVELRATTSAAASTYAGIVRLVKQAAEERPPFVRMADRYAGWFVGVTLVLAAVAWIVAGDPVRALAVLVVATPCPLILAAPAAIVGGLSNAARQGSIVKGGAVIESLAATKVVLLDKTGTITAGRPSVASVHPLADMDAGEILRFAGSLDQASVHPFAPALVAAATERGAQLSVPADVSEEVGRGIAGTVDGREVRLGQLGSVAPDAARTTALRRLTRRAALDGTSTVYVAVDGTLVAGISLQDAIRTETPRALRALRNAGVEHILLVTGDRADIAELVGQTVGVDRVFSERTPDEKVEAVREAATLGTTTMVGDGINDAPALALADTGIAMGARGATAASEAADVVLTADRLDGVATVLRIARRTRRIAWQSVVVGMGLSIIAMFAAAAGMLPPVAGALVQEAIDLAVLVNALRALRDPRRWRRTRRVVSVPADVLADHDHLTGGIDGLSELADRLDTLAPERAHAQLLDTRRFLVDELLPHELEEERSVYPAVAAAMEGEDPTVPLARSHHEIARRINMYARLVDELPPEGPDREDVLDLQRILWGLHAVLSLHVSLEDELYAELPRQPTQASAVQ